MDLYIRSLYAALLIQLVTATTGNFPGGPFLNGPSSSLKMPVRPLFRKALDEAIIATYKKGSTIDKFENVPT